MRMRSTEGNGEGQKTRATRRTHQSSSLWWEMVKVADLNHEKNASGFGEMVKVEDLNHEKNA